MNEDAVEAALDAADTKRKQIKMGEYTQANTCPKCGRHPDATMRLPVWIEHLAHCKGKA